MLSHSSERPCPAVRVLLEASGFDPDVVCLDIDVRDEMFHHCLQSHGGSPEMALLQYFRTGVDALRILEHILDGRFGAGREEVRILDFASGYGRLTRFLVGRHPPERIQVAELDPQAVAFQEKTFGVRGIVSTRAPEELVCDDGFDLIFVASLFSHLPRATFEAWMRRLWGLLNPAGVLVLTVHDAAVMLPGRTLPEDGFYFEEMSESAFLDLEQYGSTWVSKSFMSEAIALVAESCSSWARVPRGLWHLQDIYLLANGGEAAEAIGLRRGMEGYLDSCILHRTGSLELAGWAVDHARDLVEVEVELLVNGEVVDRCPADDPRPDVGSSLGDEGFAASGWGFELHAQDRFLRSSDLLLIRALRDRGEHHVLHSSSLDTALLHTALGHERWHHREAQEGLAQAQQALLAERASVRDLRQQLAAIKASGF